MAVLRDFRGVNVDMNDGRTGREGVEATGDAVVETGTEGHDQVGAL